MNNRLRFWDSYIDGYVGFIEFVNEVDPVDRAENFIPEIFDYEVMLGQGFTSIGLISDKDGYLSKEDQNALGSTYFIKPTKTSALECSNFARKYNMTKVNPSDFNVVDYETIVKSMGIREPGACILRKTGIVIPSSSEWAIKKESYSGNVNYVCSPWKCNEEHKCGIAECKEGYTGTLLPNGSNLKQNECTDQKCDAVENNYFPYCGKRSGCGDSAITFKSDDGKCHELYCPNGGTLNVKDQTCSSESCPPNTTLSNGECVPN